MITRIEDLGTMPTVGEFYSVPCVHSVLVSGKSGWVPILCRHVGDISGVDHYHADVRFISKRRFKELDVPVDAVFGGKVPDTVSIRRKRKRCLRQFPMITCAIGENSDEMFELLQDMMQNARRTCDVCPHQGISLKQVPVLDHNGQQVKVCPAHGLMWGEDGKLVRRTIRVA